MTRLYRRKPTTVEAVQWTGENFEEVQAFVGACRRYSGRTLYVSAAGGGYAHLRDWIVRSRGVLSIVSPHSFEATYEPVEDGPDMPALLARASIDDKDVFPIYAGEFDESAVDCYAALVTYDDKSDRDAFVAAVRAAEPAGDTKEEEA